MSVFQAETTQADLRPEQQAKQQITVQPYVSFNRDQKNYLYVSTGTNRVSVGDRLSLKLSISTADESHREHIKHITYLVRQEHHIEQSASNTKSKDVLITTSSTNPLRC